MLLRRAQLHQLAGVAGANQRFIPMRRQAQPLLRIQVPDVRIAAIVLPSMSMR